MHFIFCVLTSIACIRLVECSIELERVNGELINLTEETVIDFQVEPKLFCNSFGIIPNTKKPSIAQVIDRTFNSVLNSILREDSAASNSRNKSLHKIGKLLKTCSKARKSLLQFCDADLLKTLIGLDKKYSFDVREFLVNEIDKGADFNLNIPRKFLLAVYAAFFLQKPDYSKFSGLAGKTLSLEDFAALNYISSFIGQSDGKLVFSNFLPGFNRNVDTIIFFTYGVKDLSSYFPDNLIAFRHILRRLMIPTNITKFVPYTYLALCNHQNALNNGTGTPRADYLKLFESHLIKFSHAIPLSAIPKVLSLFPESSHEMLAYKLFRSYAFNVRTDGGFNRCKKYLRAISEIASKYSGIDESLSESYALFKSINLGQQFQDINGSNFALKLKDQQNSIDLSNIPKKWLIHFYQITPVTFLDRRHLALKALLPLNCNYYNVLEIYNCPDCFAFCFDYVLKRDSYQEFGQTMLFDFIDFATDKVDCSVPRSDGFGSISEIYRIGLGDSPKLEKIHAHLSYNRKKVTFFGRDTYDAQKSQLIVDKYIYFHITSPYDLFFLDLDETDGFTLQSFSHPRILNSNVNLKLDVFNYQKNPLFKNPLNASPEFIELCAIETNWTFIELAFAFGSLKLVRYILKNLNFDTKLLKHKINGVNGIDLIVKILLKYEYLADEDFRHKISGMYIQIKEKMN